MFGLISSQELDATKFNTYRRGIFHEYPQGSAPLMGFLSMMKDGEVLGDQGFGWQESRFPFMGSTALKASSDGPFYDGSLAAGAVSTGTKKTAAGWSDSIGTTIRIAVVDATKFRVRDDVWMKDQPISGYATVAQIRGVVMAVWPTPNTIDVRLTIAVPANTLNSSSDYVSGAPSGGNNLAQVNVVGSNAVEGGFSKLGGVELPIKVSNLTQTFRTVVGPWTRAALKKGQDFDKEGIYKEDAKQAQLRHMQVMEMAAFWGEKGQFTVTDSDDGVPKLENHTGGLYWYLKQWELGNVTNSGAFNYRPGGSDLTSVAWTSDVNKRIIKPGGTITDAQFDDLLYRMFYKTGDASFEKLLLGGPNIFRVINAYCRRNSIKTTTLNTREQSYGMTITMMETPYGILYMKVHPLFQNNLVLNSSAFVLDMGSVMYHHLQDSDTMLLKNRQPRDFDGRKDEWLTECGFEFKFPERHLYIEGLTGITA